MKAFLQFCDYVGDFVFSYRIFATFSELFQFSVKMLFNCVLGHNGVQRVPKLMGDGSVDEGQQFVLLLALVVVDGI